MLDLAADAAGDVKLRADGLAGLADLMKSRDPVGIHGRARRAHAGADGLGQFADHGEILRLLHAAAAGDDDVGLGQIDRALDFRHEFPTPRPGCQNYAGQFLDHGLALAAGVDDGFLHDFMPDGRHLRPVVRRDDGGHDVAAESGAGLQEVLGFRVDGQAGNPR